MLLARIAFGRGLWSEAVARARLALQVLSPIDPISVKHCLPSHTVCWAVHLRLGEPEVAVVEYRRAWQMMNEFPRMLGPPRAEVRAL
jgi:hypothetical protein